MVPVAANFEQFAHLALQLAKLLEITSGLPAIAGGQSVDDPYEDYSDDDLHDVTIAELTPSGESDRQSLEGIGIPRKPG